jgi:hypothetical protein
VKSVSKRAGSIALVSGIAVGMAAFVAGIWFPGVRQMGPMFFITSATTILALALGSRFKPDSEQEREKINSFFKKISE